MILQRILQPNDKICTEYDLYFHLDGIGAFSEADNSIHFKENSWLRFNTFFNLLSIDKWDTDCGLDDLFLEFEAEGKLELRVIHAVKNRSWDVLHTQVSTFEAGKKQRIDLSHYKDSAGLGVIYFELRAWDDEARFISGAYGTTTKDRNDISLAISITTFKREEDVRKTAVRLNAFLDDFDYGDRTHVFVVDNGQSAEVPKTSHVTPIDNPNFGGAGGFTRGLIEARAQEFTHCLFMDDDATFHMENIRRTFAYLSLSLNDRAAVSGAMISNSHKWAMWEYGAYFQGTCHPQFVGADIRNPDVVREMEFATATAAHPNTYGAWWFFAFPVKHATHLAFPFFVRGDDINFSLANDFAIQKFNGVVSFQDDFQEKEGPQTLYLDVRNHLVQSLVIDDLKTSPIRMSRMVAGFFLRHLARFHYETAEADLLAFEDVLRGPAFFRENLDMGQRRAQIKALTKAEVWEPIQDATVAQYPRHTHTRSRYVTKLWSLTLNGQSLPFIGNKQITVSISDRGILDVLWGAGTIHVIDATETNFYTVKKDRKRALSLLVRFVKLCWTLRRDIDDVRKLYEDDFGSITSQEFWNDALKMDDTRSKS